MKSFSVAFIAFSYGQSGNSTLFFPSFRKENALRKEKTMNCTCKIASQQIGSGGLKPPERIIFTNMSHFFSII